MAKKSSRLRVSLDGDRLAYCTVDRHGQTTGKIKKWSVHERSNLPRTMFFILRDSIRRELGRLEKGEKDTTVIKEAMVRGLKRAGRLCGCEPAKSSRVDVAWKIDGKWLAGFQIHATAVDQHRLKKLLKSKTIFRIVVVTGVSGYFRISPQETNREKRSAA